jgi:hypothetical protein
MIYFSDDSVLGDTLMYWARFRHLVLQMMTKTTWFVTAVKLEDTLCMEQIMSHIFIYVRKNPFSAVL